jgi:pilus assembly protein CpaE
MRAGVSECLAEPLAESDLQAALSRLGSLRSASAPGQVFAFLGAKGGVGTTTTAVNVATALSRLPGKTILIDLHLAHGDAAIFLGLEPRFSIVDALENMNRLDAAYFKGLVASGKSGPDLLASSDRAFVGTAAVQQVRQLVAFASRQYQYVVLDVPRSEAANLDALDLTTRIVVVANQELATVRNASRVSEALRRRYGKDRVAVIIARYDAESQIGQDDVERVTGTKVTGTIPSDYRLALQALNAGRPVIVENHTRLAGSFRQLAHKLAGVRDAGGDTETSGGFLGRLLGKRP